MKKELQFGANEFHHRLGAVKKKMAEGGIDVLVLSEPSNQNYLTGFNAYSFYTPQVVIVSLEHEQPIWVGRFMDRVSAVMTTWLDDDNIRAYPDTYVQSETYSPFRFMADIVKAIGGDTGRIGVEMGGYYYSARAHLDLTAALPHAAFVDADLLVGWIRLVKSPAEVDVMRQSGALADAAMARVIDLVEPGVRENEIAAAVFHQQIAGTKEFGGDYPACPPDLCVGERSIAPHAAWTDDQIRDGSVVNLEVSGVRHRYQVNMARSIVVGKPEPAYERLADIAVEALNVGLDAVRPGRTCSEVDADFRACLARHGHEKESRIGYPTGISFPPASGERTASIRKGDQTILRPGMVFHMMPGLWLDTMGVTITQSFAVTETGYEPLTHTPRQLFVK